MFIERDELERLHAKYPYPRFSDAEYQRRDSNVRGLLVFRNGTVFVLQIHLVDKARTRGLFIGDTYAMRDSGTECLNQFPPELIQLR